MQLYVKVNHAAEKWEVQEMFAHLIQMHQEGDVGPQGGGEFAVFGGQRESFRGSVGALLLSGCVQFFNPFSAVVQHNFTVPWERYKMFNTTCLF